jgi:hypothetical protein
MKGAVELAGATAVEAMAIDPPRGGGDRRDAGKAGELCVGTEAVGAGDLSDELGGGQGPAAPQLEQLRACRRTRSASSRSSSPIRPNAGGSGRRARGRSSLPSFAIRAEGIPIDRRTGPARVQVEAGGVNCGDRGGRDSRLRLQRRQIADRDIDDRRRGIDDSIDQGSHSFGSRSDRRRRGKLSPGPRSGFRPSPPRATAAGSTP